MENGMHGTLKILMLVIGAGVFATLASGFASARTGAQEREDRAGDIANSAELVAAPWVVCDFGRAAGQGTPEATGLSWDREKQNFVPLGASETFGPSRVIIAFDDDKHRATELVRIDPGTGVQDGHLHAGGEDSLNVLYPERLYERGAFPVVLAMHARNPKDNQMIALLTISYLRSSNRQFAAIFQAVRLPGGIFFFGPIRWDFSTGQSFGSCATTADGPLAQQIERARAEWLAVPLENRGTQQ